MSTGKFPMPKIRKEFFQIWAPLVKVLNFL